MSPSMLSRRIRSTAVALHAMLGVFLLAASGCSTPTGHTATTRPASTAMRLATTTSVRDSGLLDQLLPVFEARNNCRVDVVAVGTGAALRLGAVGDADALLVHAPAAEKEFLDAGHGTSRTEFMYNYFLILGPADDPAQVRQRDAASALKKIAGGKCRFVSRGDDSGTHQRERALWQQAGGRPEWDGYIASGQGMGAALIMADEMLAYVLSDHATYLNFKDKIELVPLTAQSQSLRNTYSVLAVSPDKHPAINAQMAKQLADFLVTAEAQDMIKAYHVAGQQLFRPLRPVGQQEK
ncbi:MAG: substrate-binding domain-containing protein [Planctomycetota bacterium]|nr:substrate-binding domain-containing protein [Planctomycetota bacterium]